MQNASRRIIAAALGLGVVLGSGAAVAQTTTWRFSLWIPPTHPLKVRLFENYWAKNIESATQGRVKVEFIPALGPPTAHFDLVRNGVADATIWIPSYVPARFKLTEGAELPFTSDTSLAPSVALWRVQQKHFAPAGEFNGVKLAGLWVHGPAHYFSPKAPLTKASDFQGLKVRVNGGMSAEVVQRMGGTPFFSPANQVFEVMSKGIADALLFPSESVPSFRVERIMKFATLFPGGIYHSTQALIVNEAKWNALSAADKAALDKFQGEALVHEAGKVWDAIDAEGTEEMKKVGIVFNTAPPELIALMKTRFASITEEWYAEAAKRKVDGKAALTMFFEEMAKLEPAKKM